MAMRRDVKFKGLSLLSFAIGQWVLVMIALHLNFFPVDHQGRVLIFCITVFGGALLIILSLIYMVLFGNDGTDDA